MVLVPVDLVDDEACQTWHLHIAGLAGTLTAHGSGILGVDSLVQVALEVLRHLHLGTRKLERTLEEVFGIVDVELVVAHAAIGLRHSYVLIELLAILVLNDDFYGECTGSHTNGLDSNQLVLGVFHLLETIAVVLRINAEELGTGKECLVHQQLASHVDITQIG